MTFATDRGFAVRCDHCGAVFVGSPTRKAARDDAKSLAGWTERHRYRAVRDYCRRCSQEIDSRAEARKGR